MVHLVVGVCLRLGLEAPLTADLPSPAVINYIACPIFSSSDGAALAAWALKLYFHQTTEADFDNTLSKLITKTNTFTLRDYIFELRDLWMDRTGKVGGCGKKYRISTL